MVAVCDVARIHRNAFDDLRPGVETGAHISITSHMHACVRHVGADNDPCEKNASYARPDGGGVGYVPQVRHRSSTVSMWQNLRDSTLICRLLRYTVGTRPTEDVLRAN